MRIISKETGELLTLYYRSDVIKIDFDASSGELIVFDRYAGEDRWPNAYVDLA